MLWWLTVLAIAGALVAFAGALFRWLGREERGDDAGPRPPRGTPPNGSAP